ncbi:helicase HerA-like domain-containing protein [Thermococcus barophilus]|uniref:Bipolar DNA helicase n=1 Tax=Thermococcus barophilus (strain DSM 11836 / MP) TaxID=391623 RepID=F0LKK2_THEBM|nr:ATP-binding protein [Thermococcus barophilus]ADT84836.1 bipolar DNA helicase [Thermococcus barophilus MP]
MPEITEELGSFEKIGVVTGESTHVEFYFAVEDEKMPQVWDYVVVPSNELIDGEEKRVLVLGQITSIIAYSPGLTEYVPYSVAEKLKEAEIIEPRNLAKVKILGFLHNGTVLMPRRTIYPGTYVYLAPDDILTEVYSYPEEEGLYIGNLITRPSVKVNLTIRGFRRHLAILAQTGAGKSYTAGVLLEELYKKGATVIVLDPHADYVFISKDPEGKKKVLKRVRVFRTLESTGRYTKEEIGHVETFEIKFADLSLEEIFTIAGINENWTNIMKAIEDALERLKNSSKNYTLDDLITALQTSDNNNALRALTYIKRLKKLKVFGDSTTPIGEFLQPQSIAVMDLSGLNDNVADYIAYKILSEAYNQRESGKYEYPIFILIEEAHRFIPKNQNTLSKRIVKKIAAEGRKFGVFLILVTQRPQKIDSDVLSQCNSQIIMRMTNPEDQKAVRMSAEQVSEDLLRDLPGLNVGEAIIVGEVTKMPVMVKIRKRMTKEGGADIDIVAKLREAMKAAEEYEKNLDNVIREELEKIKSIVEV